MCYSSRLYLQQYVTLIIFMIKLLQNKKGQKNLGYPRKSSPFIMKKTAFLVGTPNFFGPSYFETALPSLCYCEAAQRMLEQPKNPFRTWNY